MWYLSKSLHHLGHPSHQYLHSRHTSDTPHPNPSCSEPARPPWNIPAHLARVTSSASSLWDTQEGAGTVLGDGSPGSAHLAAAARALQPPRETLWASGMNRSKYCSSSSQAMSNTCKIPAHAQSQKVLSGKGHARILTQVLAPHRTIPRSHSLCPRPLAKCCLNSVTDTTNPYSASLQALTHLKNQTTSTAAAVNSTKGMPRVGSKQAGT